jgi:hypothetical protein
LLLFLPITQLLLLLLVLLLLLLLQALLLGLLSFFRLALVTQTHS